MIKYVKREYDERVMDPLLAKTNKNNLIIYAHNK